MDSRIRHKISLEFSQIDVEGAVESEGGGDRRHNLTDQPVQIRVCRPFNVEVAPTNVVNRFVVDHEGTVGMLQRSVGSQDGVVRLHNGGRHLQSNSSAFQKCFRLVE